MQNPELSPSVGYVPIETMHEYSTGKNFKWITSEYKTPREYLDPLDQVIQRKYAEQQKGPKDKKYVTKRGFYM